MGLARVETRTERLFRRKLETAVKAIAGSVSLWYDDGWSSQYTVAHAFHQRFLLPGTIVIPTDLVGGGNYVTVAQLQEMAASGVWAVASHGQTHTDLTTLTEDQVKTELENALAALRGWGIRRPTFFVPPFHAHNATVRKIGYLLHDHCRIGGLPLAPGASRFTLRGSYEVSENQIANLGTLAAVLDEVENLVRRGMHVPLLFHAIYDGAADVNLTRAHYHGFLAEILRRGLPVVDPEMMMQPHNLVPDGSFEWGDWYFVPNGGNAAWDQTAGNVYVGRRSLRLTWDGVTGTSSQLAHRMHAAQEAGTTYRVTWWAKGDGDATSRTRIRLVFVTEYGSTVEQTVDHDATALTAAFQRFSATYQAPAQAVAVQVRIEMYYTAAPAAAHSVWVDGLSLHPDSLTEYNVA